MDLHFSSLAALARRNALRIPILNSKWSRICYRSSGWAAQGYDYKAYRASAGLGYGRRMPPGPGPYRELGPKAYFQGTFLNDRKKAFTDSHFASPAALARRNAVRYPGLLL